MKRRKRIGAAEARRIALAAQGFDRPRPASPNDVRHYRRTMQSITVLQLDFVNVLLPAHFLMIWSRLGGYNRQRFESWLYDCGDYTEQWAHEASVVAVTDWPLLGYRRRRFSQHKNSPLNRFPQRDAYLREVLRTVTEQGAVTTQDLPQVAGPKRKPGDWHRSIPRWALEQHFGAGKLAVRKRQRNFQRVYDLPERLIPEPLRQEHVAKKDAERELVLQASRALGISTSKDLADYYRMNVGDADAAIADLVLSGDLVAVDVEGWGEAAWLAKTARAPRRIGGASLLSPFDPVVWCRPRAARMFGFDYRIEIYVPAAKRRWGYYVLPFREGDRITARVDLKADRKEGTLLVKAMHFERNDGRSRTAALLAKELSALADWLDLDDVRMECGSAASRILAAEVAG